MNRLPCSLFAHIFVYKTIYMYFLHTVTHSSKLNTDNWRNTDDGKNVHLKK